jgi:NitT/TauT family transport system substrate-binding protein
VTASLRSRLFQQGLVPLLTALSLVLAGCGPSQAAHAQAETLRLGYFPNITQATALLGVKRGIFAQALGPNVTLTTVTFNAGPAALEALLSDSIDATYVGPNPAINAYVRSKGQAIRIISGATAGGAALVVNPSITSAADLKGKRIASPQLGNTQDVALRWWLKSQGYTTTPEGGGDVSIVPQDNAQTLQAFRAGQIGGAWEPEPWATRLVLEGGGKVLVDERDLWPGGRFVTTNLVVRTDFLQQHSDVVSHLLQGQLESTDFVNQHPAEAQRVANEAIGVITGRPLSTQVIAAAWSHLTFTSDPIAPSLRAVADHAHALGLLTGVDLRGIYALGPLNRQLALAGKPPVEGL